MGAIEVPADRYSGAQTERSEPSVAFVGSRAFEKSNKMYQGPLLPRFVADKTLGRLSRWLRILGCDVLYGTNFSGKGLLAAARNEDRILLTRDRRLARHHDMPPHLLVQDDRFRAQLRQVVDAFAIDPAAALFRRCVECNTELAEVSPEAVAGRVPEFVLATQRSFRCCPGCRHVYWSATHVERARRELEAMGLAPAGLREEAR